MGLGANRLSDRDSDRNGADGRLRLGCGADRQIRIRIRYDRLVLRDHRWRRSCDSLGRHLDRPLEKREITLAEILNHCPNCGAEIKEGMTMCANCGSAIAPHRAASGAPSVALKVFLVFCAIVFGLVGMCGLYVAGTTYNSADAVLAGIGLIFAAFGIGLAALFGWLLARVNKR